MGRTTRRRSTIACIRGYLETLESRRLLHQESILPTADGPIAEEPIADGLSEKADASRGGQVRIVGGDETVEGRWPWMASLQRGSHFCGASLIAPDAVLTAAHCVEGENPADLSLVLGRHDLASTVGEVYRIADIRVHPAYNPLTNDADLAVLLLKTASDRAPMPILTPDLASLAQPGSQSVVIGWGKDDFGNLPDRMREVTVPIVSNETANRPESYGGSVTDNMLAAGLAEGGKDSCQGDSGGPLMVKNESNQYVQAGIVSWGDGCAIPMKFGLYTRVSVFADWIHQQYQLSSAGVVGITAERLSEQGTAEIVLEDADLTKLPEIKVQLSSDHGDRETVVLRATTPGRFRGGIALAPGDAVVGNGVLEVRPGGVIQATYEDEDNGFGQVATAVDSSQVVADDYGDSAEQAAIVPVPASIQGEIELAGDVDWLRFPVESGKTYRVETLLDGSLNDSVLSVYAANGQTLIVEDDDGGVGYASSATVSAGENEALFVKVAGFGSNVGTYKLNIVEYLPPADDHGDSAQTATLVEIPNRVSGELADGNDRDWFAFQAVAGQEYLLTTELGTLFDSTLRLLDSDGVTVLATNDDGGFGLSSRIRWMAPSDGVRYLEVRGHESHTGTYSVEIAPYLPLPDDHGNTFGEATSVAVPSRTNGEIEGREDRDWFSFTAIAGAHYTLQVKLDTLWDSEMWLYAPDGQTELEYSDDDSGLASLIHWTATEDGTFYARVQGYDGFEVGKYSLEIRVEEEPVDPEDDFPDRPVGAPVLALPTTTQAAINYAGDEDWFALSATAGVIYRFEVQLTTLFDSLLTLYAANGQTVVGVDDDGGDELGSLLLWTAPATATYFVVVSGFDRLQGGYKLLVNVEPPLDDFPNQAPGVTLSVPSQTAGTIGEVGDSDWFTFSATGDTTYVIETNVIVPGNATMELGDSQLKLMDQDGVTMLEFDDDGGVGNASLIRWTAPASGQYHIVVTGYNLHTGAYRLNLSVDETQNPTEDDHADKQEDATPVPISAVVGGYDETEGRVARLDAGGDVDWFSFEATAGIAYRIDARLRGLGDSLLRLTDSSGRILAANDDVAGTLGSRIFWTATATERYFVEVSSLNLADEGEYDLLVTVPYGDANLDGVFDSMDLVKLFQLGEFEDGVAENSTWASGDWNGDREFSTRDLVLAFQAGLYASNSFNGVPNRRTIERAWAVWDD